MAKIPMGNFGNAMPQVQRVQLPQNQSGQMWANTLQGAGQMAGEYAEQQRQKQTEKDKLEAATIASNFGLETEKLAGDFKQRVAAGEDAATIDREFSAEYAKRLDDTVLKIPESVRESYGPKFTEFGNRQIGSFYDIGRRTESATVKTKLELVIEQAAKMEDRAAGEQIVVDALKSAGANVSDAERIDGLVTYRKSHGSNMLNNIILTATEKSDTAALDAADAELQKKDGVYSDFDGPTTHSFRALIASRKRAIENQKQQQLEINENKRVGESSKIFNEYKAAVLTGRMIDAEYSANVKMAVKGTPYEAEYEFYTEKSKQFNDFAALGTSEQLKLINEQKAKMKNSSSADPVTEEKILAVYEETYNAKLKTAKENPNQYLAEKGIQLPELNPMEMKVNPQGFAKSVIEIGSYQLAAQAKDKNVAIKPIPPEVLPQAIANFNSATVDQKLNLIGNLIGQSKGINGGKGVWEQALKQLGGGSLNYVAAGSARLNGFGSTEGRDVATSIISGTQLLKNKQLIMPKESELKATFSQYVGQSISGTSANNAYEVFKAIYADTLDARSASHKSGDEAPNKDIAKAALEMTTGGIYDQDYGYRDYRGGKHKSWKVTKPFGMSDDDFEVRLDKGYARIAEQTGLNEADLRELRLRQGKPHENGEIQYDLIDERGKPLAVKGAIWRIKIGGVTK